MQKRNLGKELLYLAIGTIIGKITYKSQVSNILYKAWLDKYSFFDIVERSLRFNFALCIAPVSFVSIINYAYDSSSVSSISSASSSSFLISAIRESISATIFSISSGVKALGGS